MPHTKPVPRTLHLFAMLAAVLMAAQSLALGYLSAGWSAPRGTAGLTLDQCTRDHRCVVVDVFPGGAAARAGIVKGDSLVPDRFWESQRALRIGDVYGATVRQAGRDRHVQLFETAQPPFFSTSYIIAALAFVAINLIALLILARAGRGWTGFLLGCALISYAEPGAGPRFWQNDYGLYIPTVIVLGVIWLAGPLLMLLAMRRFRRDVTGSTPRWIDWLIGAVIPLTGVVLIWNLAERFNNAPVLGTVEAPVVWLLAIVTALTPLVLWTGWREVPPDSRTRYRFMAAAVSVLTINVLGDLVIHVLANNDYISASWPVFLKMGGLIATAILFAYALLRHRVVDLGFAVNRTLVYSSLSFVVLLAFGLVEFAAEKLLPFESHEASVVVDAGIALALFLAFHRIHGWVEHAVERVFFHRWHANEAALAGFLRQAAYITDADVLADRAVGELRRFTGGAAAAIYRIDEHGPALKAGGVDGVPARLGIDDPALVAMRADRALVRDAWITGALALPMLHRADVIGLVLAGPKPDGNPYRPDEEAQLGEAARRIGVDLFALRVEELERANTALSARVAALAGAPGVRDPAAIAATGPVALTG